MYFSLPLRRDTSKLGAANGEIWVLYWQEVANSSDNTQCSFFFEHTAPERSHCNCVVRVNLSVVHEPASQSYNISKFMITIDRMTERAAGFCFKLQNKWKDKLPVIRKVANGIHDKLTVNMFCISNTEIEHDLILLWNSLSLSSIFN